MSDHDMSLDELTSLYSEACQAFVLRDFDTAASIVDDLLDRIERDDLGLASSTEEITTTTTTQLDELVRRVWILQTTLLASSDEELARNAKQAERELAGLYSRIERFYSQGHHSSTASASSASTSSFTTTLLIHPSLLVAISLAGLKLEIPSFVRRTLQDYFRLLLKHAASSEAAAASSSQADISTLDTSQADLSLSGIAINGHGHPAANGLNGTNGHLNNGTSTSSGQAATSASTSRLKSLHRLARIYSVHLLGKTLGEWSAARAWIREQADDDAAVAAGLMNDSYAQVGLLSNISVCSGQRLLNTIHPFPLIKR